MLVNRLNSIPDLLDAMLTTKSAAEACRILVPPLHSRTFTKYMRRAKKGDLRIEWKGMTASFDEHVRTARALAPIFKKDYRTIRDFSVALLLFARCKDKEDRSIGFDYHEILRLISKKFPVVTYPGPHKGKPSTMRVKDLISIACDVNRGNVKLPMCPRRRVNKKK